MKLHQIDMVGLQTVQGFVDLLGGDGTLASIDLAHQEDAFAVTVHQRFAHPHLARAVLVIPTVVHECNAAVDGAPNDADAFLLIALLTDVIPPETDDGDVLAGAAEGAVQHLALANLLGAGQRYRRGVRRLICTYGRLSGRRIHQRCGDHGSRGGGVLQKLASGPDPTSGVGLHPRRCRNNCAIGRGGGFALDRESRCVVRTD